MPDEPLTPKAEVSPPRGWRGGVEEEARRLGRGAARAPGAGTASVRGGGHGRTREPGTAGVKGRSAAIHDEVASAVSEALRIARERPRNPWRRLVDAWTGARFEAALGALHRAREGLVLTQSDAAVI